MYIFFINIFTFQIFNKINKLCFNDTLLSLYVLSSSSLTIWFLFYLIYIIFFKMHKCIKISLLIIYLSILFYFHLNCFTFNFLSTLLTLQNINTTLQNGLLNIHPIYIYIIYAYMYIIWYCRYKFYNEILYNGGVLSNYFNIVCIIIIGIYLGAFWASQELNWGGFWSWDPVELVSLILFFWFILIFHNRNSKILNKPINHVLIITIIIYFIIRLGAVTTIHSFIKTNVNPFYINFCLNSIIIFIYTNKNKYYYLTSKNLIIKKIIKLNAIHVIIILLSNIYLAVYIFLLLSFVNLSVLTPIQWYFLLIVTSIYLMHKPIKTEFYKHIINLIVFLFTFFIIKINIVVLILLVLFLYTFYFFKHIQLHTLLIISYFIFFIFFININIYKSSFINIYKSNFNLNSSNSSLIFYNNYETCFFLKKCLYLVKLKNLWIHVSGFSIITNNNSSLFLFSKNNRVYFIFTLEVIYILIYYLIFLCLSMLLNYKYIRPNFFNSCTTIKFY